MQDSFVITCSRRFFFLTEGGSKSCLHGYSAENRAEKSYYADRDCVNTSARRFLGQPVSSQKYSVSDRNTSCTTVDGHRPSTPLWANGEAKKTLRRCKRHRPAQLSEAAPRGAWIRSKTRPPARAPVAPPPHQHICHHVRQGPTCSRHSDTASVLRLFERAGHVGINR